MKKTTLLILALIMLSTRAAAIDLSAKSAVLMDLKSGRILYSKNGNEKLPMASTTKIMTGLLAAESGKMKKNVTVSPVASGTEGSSLWLEAGEKHSLENLTYGLMLKSGNDSAVAIAEFLGGSCDAFALLMTQRARDIGALNTTFKNPHGLDAVGHFTTASDLALISREALKNKKFAKIVATKQKTIPWEGKEWERALKNHNKMLWRYDGCTGVKTGFTKKSGRCLVTSAVRGDKSLICVTLNAPNDWNDHTLLLDYGFNNYNTRVVCEKNKKAGKFVYDKKRGKSVPLIFKNDFSVMLADGEKVECKIEYKKIKPPFKEKQTAATMHIYINKKEIGKVPLVCAKSVK